MSDLPTGTVTFLLTDIEGSTRLWEERPSDMARAVQIHEEIAREEIESFGGHLLLERGEGDSLFAVFNSPSAATRAAHNFQRRLQEPVAGILLKVRMGIHIGEAQARGSTYFGRAVNRAARIRGVASGGQIIVSAAVKHLAEAELSHGIEFWDCGRHRLRDLLQAEQLFEVTSPALPRTAAPLRSLELHQHNLPVQLTSFIGRQVALEECLKLVRDHRLVSIVGAGGCGKTRLSLQIGAELLIDFPDGVWLVEAAPIRNASTLADEVNRALGLTGQAGSGQTIATRAALLIVDNCEHLREAAANVARDVLTRAPELHILTTTREALGLRGERIYPLHSMILPPRSATVDHLEEYEASALFLERSREKDPTLDFSDRDAQAIIEIVRVVDGIPLAIEQVASHVGFLSPPTLLQRLDEWMLRPADYQAEHDDPRHRTLEAAIEWSYSLLTTEEQTLWLRLSVFAGGWNLGAAELVCSDDDLPAHAIAPLMQQLLNKSLITIDSEWSHAGRRFRFLEPIRQFTAKRRPLAAIDIRGRHFEHYFAQALTLDRDLEGERQHTALQEAESDRNNYLAALDYAMAERQPLALKLAFALRRFWLLRGHAAEGQERLQRALALNAQPPEMTAKALNAVGAVAYQRGDYETAASSFRDALASLDDSTEPRMRTGILHNLGLVLEQLGKPAEAEASIRRSIAEMDELALGAESAQARLSLANLLLNEGRAKEATPLLVAAAETFRNLGNKTLLALVQARVSESLFRENRSAACKALAESLDLNRELQSKTTCIVALLAAAMLATDAGDRMNSAFLIAAAEHFSKEEGGEFSRAQRSFLESAKAQLGIESDDDVKRSFVRGSRAGFVAAMNVAEAALSAD